MLCSHKRSTQAAEKTFLNLEFSKTFLRFATGPELSCSSEYRPQQWQSQERTGWEVPREKNSFSCGMNKRTPFKFTEALRWHTRYHFCRRISDIPLKLLNINGLICANQATLTRVSRQIASCEHTFLHGNSQRRRLFWARWLVDITSESTEL